MQVWPFHKTTALSPAESQQAAQCDRPGLDGPDPPRDAAARSPLRLAGAHRRCARALQPNFFTLLAPARREIRSPTLRLFGVTPPPPPVPQGAANRAHHITPHTKVHKMSQSPIVTHVIPPAVITHTIATICGQQLADLSVYHARTPDVRIALTWGRGLMQIWSRWRRACLRPSRPRAPRWRGFLTKFRPPQGSSTNRSRGPPWPWNGPDLCTAEHCSVLKYGLSQEFELRSWSGTVSDASYRFAGPPER
jgi:hypothetical protein